VTTKLEIRPFAPRFLGPLIVLINEAISGRRLAAPVVGEEFEGRVVRHPGFDAAGLLLAIGEDGEVLGAAHAIVPPASIPRYAGLAGQGFLFGPFVREASRSRGVGRALLAEAEAALSGRCQRVSIHGLRAPFYHWHEGPRQPYCGSTEMVGLTTEDAGLLAFLGRAGYRPVAEQEVSLLVPLGRPGFQPARVPGLSFVRASNERPWHGPVAWAAGETTGYGYERYGETAYDTLALVEAGTIVGHCQWYPMRQPGRAALYDLRLEASLRGRGFGRALLEGGLAAMAEAGFGEAELHASPQRNPVAFQMYLQRGFREVARWIALEKDLL
jgi:GNAT superfamily N-acetyltransferase